MSLKSFIKTITVRYKLWKRLPVLPYIETHVADHCNLKCAGCSHFSPIAPEYYVDIKKFEKDIKQLSKRLNFASIRLLGGEPLLHPDVNSFAAAARKYFPKSRIAIVTNGILLDKMPEYFWETCRKYNITIDLSKYPGNESIFPKVTDLIKSKNVRLGRVHPGDKMFVFGNQIGTSNPKLAFNRCGIKYYNVTVLRAGKMYTCPKAAYADIYNNFFKTNIEKDEGINIYKNSGKEIIKYIKSPAKTCKYCLYYGSWEDWKLSDKNMNEWNIYENESDIPKALKFMLKHIQLEEQNK